MVPGKGGIQGRWEGGKGTLNGESQRRTGSSGSVGLWEEKAGKGAQRHVHIFSSHSLMVLNQLVLIKGICEWEKRGNIFLF